MAHGLFCTLRVVYGAPLGIDKIERGIRCYSIETTRRDSSRGKSLEL